MPYFERGFTRVAMLQRLNSINGPTATEINAGTDITAALSEFNPRISTVSADRTPWRSRQTVDVPIKFSVALDVKAYRELTDASDQLWRLSRTFGVRRILVVRRGVAVATAWAAGQRIEIFDCRIGKRSPEQTGRMTPAQFSLPLFCSAHNDDALVA